MRREYFIYDEGRMYRASREDYIEHFERLRNFEQTEVEISYRDFGACKIEFFYFCDELEGMEVSYVDPGVCNGLSDPGEVNLRERV